MSFKEKVKAFVARHGFTYKAYILSILFLPPAAVYIAWKRPGLPLSAAFCSASPAYSRRHWSAWPQR